MFVEKLLKASSFKFFQIPLSLIIPAIFANYLEIAEFGKLSIFIALMNLFLMPVTSPVISLVTREVAIDCYDFRLYKILGGIVFFLMLSVVLILIFIKSLHLIYILLPVMFYLQLLVSCYIGLLRGRGFTLKSAACEYFVKSFFVFVVVIVVVILQLKDFYWFAFAYLCSGFMTCVTCLKLCPAVVKSTNKISVKLIKSLFHKLAPLVGSSIISIGIIESQVLLIGYVKGEEMAGVMRIYLMLLMMAGLPLTILNAVASKQVVSMYKKGRIDALNVFLRYISRTIFLLSLLGVVVFLINFDFFIKLVFPDYSHLINGQVGLVYMIASLVNIAFGNSGMVAAMIGRASLVTSALFKSLPAYFILTAFYFIYPYIELLAAALLFSFFHWNWLLRKILPNMD